MPEPPAAPRSAAPAPAPIGPASADGLQISVCDESIALRTVIDELLTLDGNVVCSFESGPQLWASLAKGPPYPDVLIVELHMPGMTGLELLGRLQATDFKGQVILLASTPDAAMARKCMLRHAHVWLEKPFPFRILRQIVAQLRKAKVGGESVG